MGQSGVVTRAGSGTAVADRDRRLMRVAAWGFVVGSALFMLGVPLSLMPSLSPTVAAWTYVVGAVFFTSAATFQTVAAGHPADEPDALPRGWAAADRANLIAALLQWVGTLEFNVTTLRSALDAAARGTYDAAAVWRPDAVGSVLFLVSSAVALAPEVHRRRLRHVRDRAWAVAGLNMVGSVFFGLSAVGAWTVAATGEPLSLWWANAGTFLGGVCFLAGAILMLPRPSTPSPVDPA